MSVLEHHEGYLSWTSVLHWNLELQSQFWNIKKATHEHLSFFGGWSCNLTSGTSRGPLIMDI